MLSLTLASVLLALSAAAGLPLLAPRLGLISLSLLVCGFSALPLLLAFWPTRPLPAPTFRAWPGGELGAKVSGLMCAAAGYAERVAALNGGELSQAVVPERWGSAWLSAGPVLGLGAACLSFFVYHPLLRVLNLGPVRVQVAPRRQAADGGRSHEQ